MDIEITVLQYDQEYDGGVGRAGEAWELHRIGGI